ncbi:MAG TPA: hypothetical protein VM145_07980 [Sphingomicrobium sp.]|nr:hypothetical protein [Sphingomicrobium sp.]
MDAILTTPAGPSSHRQAKSVTVPGAVLAAVVVYAYGLSFPALSDDMRRFLLPWFDHIVRYGPVGAFAHPFSNYSPPYLYLLALTSLAHGVLPAATLIKLLSLAGTLFLAVSFGDLLKAIGVPARKAVALLALPTVIMNGALMGQCDALWSGACILAVAAMIRGRTATSLAWCGVAVAFKAQAVFIAPFIIGVLVQRRLPLWHWAIPALAFAVLMLPAAIAGWPVSDLLTVYFRQAGEFDFAGRLATPWVWVGMSLHDAAQKFYVWGYALAAAVAVGIAVLSFRAKQAALLPAALMSAIALPFFLPRMHERYFFLADVLSLALAFTLRNRMAITAAVAMQVASLLSLLSFFFLSFYQRPFPTLVGSLFAAAALIATWRMLRNDEDRLPPPREATPALA